jgi:hypothetical protein
LEFLGVPKQRGQVPALLNKLLLPIYLDKEGMPIKLHSFVINPWEVMSTLKFINFYQTLRFSLGAQQE